MRRLGLAAFALLVALAGCSTDGDGAASTTAPAASATTRAPSTSPATTVAGTAPVRTSTPGASTPGATAPVGYAGVAVRVRPPGTADPRDWCLWLAATAEERGRGLMEVTSLGAAPGMLFDFGGTTSGQFWMYQTLIPLSIAFYDDQGAFVSATDMEPCTSSDTSECARYAAEGPYAFAVETAVGDLERLGLVPGSRLEVGESCTPG